MSRSSFVGIEIALHQAMFCELNHFCLISAGGTGVMLNIDRVAENLRAKGADIHVKGIVDSGWFLDNESIKSRNCGLPHGRCTPSDVIKTAMHYWHADLPIDCIRNKTPDKQHLCFFGDELYPYIKSKFWSKIILLAARFLLSSFVGAFYRSPWAFLNITH